MALLLWVCQQTGNARDCSVGALAACSGVQLELLAHVMALVPPELTQSARLPVDTCRFHRPS